MAVDVYESKQRHVHVQEYYAPKTIDPIKAVKRLRDALTHARQMLDAAWGAFKAAKAKDASGVEAVSDQLYESCVSCHKAYRPNYGKPKPPQVRKFKNYTDLQFKTRVLNLPV